MFNFLKPGIEFNNLAKTVNGMNVMIQDIIPKIARSHDYSEFTDDVLVLAYIARKGVLDRMEKYKWSMDAKLFAPTIKCGPITLAYAYTQTVDKLHIIVSQLDLSEIVEEIMEKGEMYFQIDRNMPDKVKKNI